MTKYFILLLTAFVLFSCGKDTPAPGLGGSDTPGTSFGDPANLEIWIDSNVQKARLFRVRKANGASRMRLLVDLPDSIRFTLFVTPFETGSYQIETGNIADDDDLKFSRTHSEFKQLINESHFFWYEVDTAQAYDNRVEITQIDTIQRTVAGQFRCHMTIDLYAGVPVPEKVVIWGHFYSTYRD